MDIEELPSLIYRFNLWPVCITYFCWIKLLEAIDQLKVLFNCIHTVGIINDL